MPVETVREGSRWRYAKPSGDDVAKWFETSVLLDEGMEHARYVSGIVLIPAQEKVKRQVEKNGRLAVEDSYEMTYTPYVRVDTRVAYFRTLAAHLDQIAVIEPVKVPVIAEGEAANAHMPPGFWWHLVPGENGKTIRHLCCTMRVALYDKDAWTKPLIAQDDTSFKLAFQPRALREGVATKQITAAAEANALAKAETGAVGRALGMAGILVIGTGIATAEDLAEATETPAAVAALPESAQVENETPEQLGERILRLQGQLADQHPTVWAEVAAWWASRQQAEGWSKLEDAPLEVRRGMATRMERRLEEADQAPDSSPEPTSTVPGGGAQ